MNLKTIRCRFGKGWDISEHNLSSTGRSDFAEKIGESSLPFVSSERDVDLPSMGVRNHSPAKPRTSSV